MRIINGLGAILVGLTVGGVACEELPNAGQCVFQGQYEISTQALASNPEECGDLFLPPPPPVVTPVEFPCYSNEDGVENACVPGNPVELCLGWVRFGDCVWSTETARVGD